MSEVRFRRSAQADVQKAFEYFESKSPGLGVEFIDRVEEAAAKISRNPETYRTVFQDVRRASLRQFKYARFYRIETDGSVVIACLGPPAESVARASKGDSDRADLIGSERRSAHKPDRQSSAECTHAERFNF